jgi:hypothetical protein
MNQRAAQVQRVVLTFKSGGIHHIRCCDKTSLQVGDQQNQGKAQHVQAKPLFGRGSSDDHASGKVGNTGDRLICERKKPLFERPLRR